jgi:Na+-transporting methylmalonyl-CoA/oxaloacetate decarboxylase gamma subunit
MIRDLWEGPRYSTEELNVRLKFFIGIILGLTLFGIVFVVLYSLIFVTQPMNGMSPVDNKFFELIIPIATFLTGTLSGIMLAGDDKELRAKAIEAANKPPPPSAPLPSPSISPRPVSPSPMPVAAMAGAAGVMAGAAMVAAGPAMPTMDKPMPSRPPLDEDFPPLD